MRIVAVPIIGLLRMSTLVLTAANSVAAGQDSGTPDPNLWSSWTRKGWTVHVRKTLERDHPEKLSKAMELLDRQLEEIAQVLPGEAVAELRKVPLFFSPRYPGVPPRAEYHPGADWLRKNGRDPVMVRGVEFTNVAIFEAETRRMPNFVLHELAHAYHHRVLGHDQSDLKAAYERALKTGLYQKVDRVDSRGVVTQQRAYALTNVQEYFAECSEAYFGRNDFFPFTRAELEAYDPEMFRVIGKVWGVVK